MRRSGWMMLLLGFAILLGLMLSLPFQETSKAIETKMPDGTLLRIEKLTHGTNHVFASSSRLGARLWQLLPGPLKGVFGPPSTISISTEKTNLVLWFRQRDPVKQATISPTLENRQLIDEHGCTFEVNNWGTQGSYPTDSINFSQLEAFPRRQNQFIFSASASRTGPVVQVSVPNPFQVNPRSWSAEPLPIQRRAGQVEFVCTQITGRRVPGGAYLQPRFKVFVDGQDRTDWYAPSYTFVDETGNRGYKLCAYEPVLKLEVDFYKSFKAPFAETEVTTIRGVVVPEPGEVIQKDASITVSNATVTFVALCGPGEFKFSNAVCLAASPWKTGSSETSRASSSSQGSGELVELEFGTKNYTLLLNVQNVPRYKELLVRARDEEGNFYRCNFNASAGRMHRYEVDLPSGVRKVDLEFAPQHPVKVEFMVKPPDMLK